MTIFDELKNGIVSDSPARTEAIGARLARALPPDSALALHGDLGSGKTTLVRGLARGIGYPGAVTSPTYNIYSIYPGSRRQLLHMDAYRIHDASELDSLAIEDFLVSPFLVAVEWPERVADFLGGFPLFSLQLDCLGVRGHRIRTRASAG
jgi:tRNA threonylcarbamoyladenosine biosynthesis protein TsaE